LTILSAVAILVKTQLHQSVMRLSQEQQAIILNEVQQVLGADAKVSLYGSRINDQAKGGDVDLLLELNQAASLLQLAALKVRLESLLTLPVDLLVSDINKQASPFITIAKSQAQLLVAA
jgi:uncharacterized protein